MSVAVASLAMMLGVLSFARPAGAASPIGSVSAFSAPGIVNPHGIVTGPDGNLWFTNWGGDTIGRMTPTGTLTTFANPAIQKPEIIVAGPDGNLWFTSWNNNSIDRITPSGTVTPFTAAGVNGPYGLAVGSDGNLWFTNQPANTIGRITTGGTVTTFIGAGIDKPSMITAGPDGNLWFTNSNGNSIGTITTSGIVTSHPGAGIDYPFGITTGPDGNLWFSNSNPAANTIGRMTTAGAVTTFAGPGISSVFGIAAGPDGNLWFSNGGNSSIGRITPAGAVSNFTDPTVKKPAGITVGPDGNMWFGNFGEFDPPNQGNSIGSIGTLATPGIPLWAHAQRGDTTATVTWWPAADNGSPITGYVITPRVNGVAGSPRSSGPTATTQVITGLINGTTYTFDVAAINDTGTGRPATTPPITVGSPAAPIWAHATRGDSTAGLLWWPPSNNGSPITGYTITPVVNGVEQSPHAAGPAATGATISGLTNGTSYAFRITARNANGTGATATTPVLVVGTPAKPLWTYAVPNPTGATVTWWPTTPNGSPLTGYTITPVANGVPQTPRSVGATATSASLIGLTPGASYTFQVTPHNAFGAGGTGTSAPITVT